MRTLDAASRARLRPALRNLGEKSAGLDIKVIAGHAPWFRLRVGDLRVIYRALGRDDPREGYLVARVINRRDLERALKSI